MTEVVRIVVREPETVRVGVPGLEGPPGPPGAGDMQKLVYDPRGFELDIFELGHMTGVLDAGTF